MTRSLYIRRDIKDTTLTVALEPVDQVSAGAVVEARLLLALVDVDLTILTPKEKK